MKNLESIYKNYFKELTPYLFCLIPLLEALKSNRTPRDIIQSFPHFSTRLELKNLLRVMKILGYEYHQFESSLDKVHDHFLPSLFITKKSDPYVVLKRDNDEFIAYSGQKREEIKLPKQTRGIFFAFHLPTKYEHEIRRRKATS